MNYVLCILMSYAIGCINPAYIIGKIKGMDIREKGSCNAGGSNALILFGKVMGILCMLFDIGKSCLAIWLSGVLFTEMSYIYSIAGCACILGHMFPFYMGFRGGKGTASLGGMVLMLDWRIFLVFLAVEIVIVLITDYLCFMPITAVIIFPILYGVYKQDLWGAIIILSVTAAVLYKNIENIKRMLNGTEVHFSFLWNKDKEINRVTGGEETDMFDSKKGDENE